MVSEKVRISQTMNWGGGNDRDRRDVELRTILERDDSTAPLLHELQCEGRVKVGAETNGIGLTDREQ